jgi:TRAP transporter TAXI family solute receptor
MKMVGDMMSQFFSKIGTACALVSLFAFSAASHAQTLSIGTNPQGSVAYASGAAIADVVGDALDLSFTVVPQGGPTAIIPAMSAGEFDFAFANIVAAVTAKDGKGPYKGRKYDSIRVAAVVYPLEMGVFVRKDAKIDTFQALKGKRVASAFKSQANVAAFMTASLAAAGLSYDDVIPVPVQNGVQSVNELVDGGLDATTFSVSAGIIQQADAVVGIRVLSLPNDEAAQAALDNYTPGAMIATAPAGSYPGILEPTNIIRVPFVVLTDSRVDDETVYKVVKAIAENGQKLAASAGEFKALDPKLMGQSALPVPYHPGAIKYYTEQGTWN